MALGEYKRASSPTEAIVWGWEHRKHGMATSGSVEPKYEIDFICFGFILSFSKYFYVSSCFAFKPSRQ